MTNEDSQRKAFDETSIDQFARRSFFGARPVFWILLFAATVLSGVYLFQSKYLISVESLYDRADAYRYADKPDYKKAFDLYQQAAERGHARAQHSLAYFYEKGVVAPKNEKAAFDWYLRAAEAGYGNAQFNLGNMYRDGRGVAQDFTKAIHWYTLSAEQGRPMAMNNLAGLYMRGDGVAQDFDRAFEWLNRAAEAGLPEAHANIGLAYQSGRGVERDYNKAAEHYLVAVTNGHKEAQRFLAQLYANGLGVERDYLQSGSLYRRGAELGDTKAQSYLKEIFEYCDPTVLPPSAYQLSEEQTKACLIAAGADYPPALYMAGIIYSRNHLVQRDRATAISLLRRAVDLGYAPATERLRMIESEPVDAFDSPSDDEVPGNETENDTRKHK